MTSPKILKKTTQEVGGAWPIIGHLYLSGGSQPPHISLGNLADKYGGIFTIKLGVHRALVVSHWEIAKECLTINDKAFATHPKLSSSKILGYNCAIIVFALYGPYMHQVRKFATIELFSNHRLEMLKPVRESEVKTSLSNCSKVIVEMKRWFRDVTLNVILRIVVGKRILNSYEGDEIVKWKKSLHDLFKLTEELVVSDALPGNKKIMQKVHKEKRAENEANSEEDFMGVMLSILRDAKEHDVDTINKTVSLVLAEDIISITIIWALYLLLNNWEALNKLSVPSSFIKETLHLYLIAPLVVIHEAIEDCSVRGYNIPIKDPLKFQPIKFVTIHKDIDVKGPDFELIPFNNGRKILCSGVLFAVKILKLTLIETLSNEVIDICEDPGLTNLSTTPLEVQISLCLPTFVYQSNYCLLDFRPIFNE
ncbi:hypothetical protein GOBAR_AA30305 [Gossypium barbadense]|uniref:Cytochrome P450 n=1 Tax=Gossypium barbadense TaxID=3634 RepID=A0A2P5WH44_GOSBA|nr:hypothetical protein GOBAR_AA30305 [Gossypium barbadense]